MSWGFGDDSKKKKSIFDPVDSWGSTNPNSASSNSSSWGWSAEPGKQGNFYSTPSNSSNNFYGSSNNNTSNNFYSNSNSNSSGNFYSNQNSNNFYGNSNQNNNFYSSNNNSPWSVNAKDARGHWGSQRGYGFGDSHGFGNDHNIRDMENMYSSNSWGSGGGDGSAWHFSNAGRDLDLHHGITSARQVNENNSVFSGSWGMSPTKSHFAKAPSTPSSFNPFSPSPAPSNSFASSTPSSFNPFSNNKKKNWG